MPCNECNDTHCEGVNKLRQFATWEDLSAHLSEQKILEYVNALAAWRADQKTQHRKYNLKRRMLEKAARELLDPDELALIERQAAEKVEERG